MKHLPLNFNIPIVYPLFVLTFVVNSCFLPKNAVKWQNKGLIPLSEQVIIGQELEKCFKVTYTGCGGLAIDFGKDVILTDPYFSNQPFLSIMLGKINSNPEAVELGLAKLGNAGITGNRRKHVFIAHSHYDHLMDVPFLLETKWLSDVDHIYGSTTTCNILGKFLYSDSSFTNIELPSGWIRIAENLRVLPILSDHAPHFLNIRLMEGEVTKKGIPNLVAATDKTKATDWKGGKIYSFLIDYLENDKVAFRIFIQSSSAAPPAGFPPPDELKNKNVDMAFVGVASSTNVKGYPNELLKILDPATIVLMHWEDFFRPYGQRPKTVRMTNFNKFFKRLRKTYSKEDVEALKQKVIMPSPGTTLNVFFQ